MDGANLANVIVRVWNARGELVKNQQVRTRPHQTFERVMRKTCEAIDCELADYDVSSGGLLLNGNTDEMRAFGIPGGQCLLVDLNAKSIDSCF